MAHRMRAGAVAGVLAPQLFLLATIAISWVEEGFMEELGWDVWPSGLALGPDGWLQMVNFVLLGVLLAAFALAVATVPARNRSTKLAPLLLALAAISAALLAFKTDPPDQDATWHGTVHWVAYVIWVSSLVVSYPFTWWRVRGNDSWRRSPRWTGLLALLLFPPVYLLPDSESAGNYYFLAVVMTPLVVIAARLTTGTRDTTEPSLSRA